MQAGGRTISGLIRLTVPAGKAAPAPPVGPALGQKVPAVPCARCPAPVALRLRERGV